MNIKRIRNYLLIAAVMLLANCGGGGITSGANQCKNPSVIMNVNAAGKTTDESNFNNPVVNISKQSYLSGEISPRISPTDKICTDNPVKEISTDDTGATKILDATNDFTYFDITVDAQPSLLSKLLGKNYYIHSLTNYGIPAYIDFRVKDNFIYVLWIDEKEKRHLSKISLANQSIVDIPIPKIAQYYKTPEDKDSKTDKTPYSTIFLGFEVLSHDEFIIGYSKDNTCVLPSKATSDNRDAAALYTVFKKDGSVIQTISLWEARDLSNEKDVGAKGYPASASSAVIKYDQSNDIIAIYLGYKKRFGDKVMHQGGWFGYLKKGNNGQYSISKVSDKENAGNSWFYSHNFDQRLLVSSENNFYALAHGDAYPRDLGIYRFSGPSKKEDPIGIQYYKIKNSKGGNDTYSTTGDFAELANKDVAIVYSTEECRDTRDQKIAIVKGMNGTKPEPKIIAERWITKLPKSENTGWGSKVIQYNDDYILIGWNVFSGNKKGTGSYFALVKNDGTTMSTPYKINDTVLYPAQSFHKIGDKIIFVSGAAGNKLRVHVIKTQ